MGLCHSVELEVALRVVLTPRVPVMSDGTPFIVHLCIFPQVLHDIVELFGGDVGGFQFRLSKGVAPFAECLEAMCVGDGVSDVACAEVAVHAFGHFGEHVEGRCDLPQVVYPVTHPHECPADAVCILGEGIVDGSVLKVDRVCLCLKGCPAQVSLHVKHFLRAHFPLPCSQRKFTEAGEEADEVV